MKYDLKPYVLGLRLTERCNVGCFHCAISATPKGKDMEIKLAEMVIKQAAECGIRLLHLTGGEPLLYRELERIIQLGTTEGMEVELVTSSFSYPDNEKFDFMKPKALISAGLKRILISYDDAHSKKVTLEHFLQFVVLSIESGLDVCIYGIDSEHFKITSETIKNTFIAIGLDTDKIDFIGANYSYTGRGAILTPSKVLPRKGRCPYIMPVPTIVPSGNVLLCPCAILPAKAFTLGNIQSNLLGHILEKFRISPFYRFLALKGPFEALIAMDVDEDKLPVEICSACNLFLEIGLESFLAKVPMFDAFTNAWVDYEALLPPHRRFLNSHHIAKEI